MYKISIKKLLFTFLLIFALLGPSSFASVIIQYQAITSVDSEVEKEASDFFTFLINVNEEENEKHFLSRILFDDDNHKTNPQITNSDLLREKQLFYGPQSPPPEFTLR